MRKKKREMENRGRHGEIDEDVQTWRKKRRVRLKEKRKRLGGKRGKDRGTGEDRGRGER